MAHGGCGPLLGLLLLGLLGVGAVGGHGGRRGMGVGCRRVHGRARATRAGSAQEGEEEGGRDRAAGRRTRLLRDGRGEACAEVEVEEERRAREG